MPGHQGRFREAQCRQTDNDVGTERTSERRHRFADAIQHRKRRLIENERRHGLIRATPAIRGSVASQMFVRNLYREAGRVRRALASRSVGEILPKAFGRHRVLRPPLRNKPMRRGREAQRARPGGTVKTSAAKPPCSVPAFAAADRASTSPRLRTTSQFDGALIGVLAAARGHRGHRDRIRRPGLIRPV